MLVPGTSVMNWAIRYHFTAYNIYFVFLLVVSNTGMNGCLGIESLNYNFHLSHWSTMTEYLLQFILETAHNMEKARLGNSLTVAGTQKLHAFHHIPGEHKLLVKHFKLRRISKS